MKYSLVLILFSVLILPSKQKSEKTSTPTDIFLPASDAANTPLQDSIIKADTIITREPFLWSSDYPCKLGNYNVHGLIPTMRDALAALSLEERLTNGLNRSKARSNYHGVDYTSNGIDYSAAIDISVRCLTEDQIRNLLDELSMRGFAAWYRKKREDGWNGVNHIHAIWVASPLKQQLVIQVKKWLSGKNGLTSDKDYEFWTPQPDAVERIRSAFSQSNPTIN